jgi:acyl carrier protein
MGFVELLVVIEKVFNLRLIESGLTREDFETIHALATRISKGLQG